MFGVFDLWHAKHLTYVFSVNPTNSQWIPGVEKKKKVDP